MRLRVGIPLIQNTMDGNTAWVAGFYYVKNCLNALAYLPDDDKPDVFVFVSESFKESILLPEFAENTSWLKIIKIPGDRHGNSFEIQEKIDNNPCDLFFPLNTLPVFNFDAPMIGWIPDFQHKHLPHFFSEEDILNRNLISNFILKHSHIMVCSSHVVAEDIEAFYPKQQNKVAILQFKSIISSSLLTASPVDSLKKFNIERKYILLPNQFWIHKNHKAVFEVWNKLKTNGQNYLLVCTGAPNDYRHPTYFNELISYIKDNKLEDNILILGFINRFEQIQLMRNAAAILQPSLFEGWNTSVEDARSLGKPLIISDISVHREQCQENAYYFDIKDPLTLLSLIQGIWDILPIGYDKQAEIEAQESYKKEIQAFGNSLLNIFKSTQIAPVISNDIINIDDRALVLKLNSELQIWQAHLTARLDLITELNNRLINYKLIYRRFKKLFLQIKLFFAPL